MCIKHLRTSFAKIIKPKKMKIKQLSLGVLLVLGLTIFNGCNKDDVEFKEEIEAQAKIKDENSKNGEEGEVEHGLMVLGNQLQNPYSVANMQAAKDYLSNEGSLINNIPVTLTHYYVRFLPADHIELEVLESNDDLHLYDFPLDYEIVENGHYYHDPSIPDSMQTWQYTVVPVGYPMPNVTHEILADLFLHEDDGVDEAYDIGYEQIETQSLLMTGNEDPEELQEGNRTSGDSNDEELHAKDKPKKGSTNNKGWRKSKWRPTGSVKVYDDISNTWKPVVGVEVRARRWFTTRTARTDANGNFSTHRFRRAVNYSLVWDYYNFFNLRTGSYGQARLNGPKRRSSWHVAHDKGSFWWVYGTSFRAAHIYYDQHWRWGIKRPTNGNQMLHIGIKDKNGTAHYFDFNKIVRSAQVVLYYPYRNKNYSANSRDVFATTVHEVAHASHWDIANQNLNWLQHSGKTMVESWATGVETVLTNHYYPDYHHQFQTISFKSTIWGQRITNNYTSIVEDMIDDFNQSNYTFHAFPPARCSYGGTLVVAGYKFGLPYYSCEVGSAPAGTWVGVWPNNQGAFYHQTLAGNTCPAPAWYDGANCYYADIPNNWHGYATNGKFYLDVVPRTDPLRPVDHVNGYTLQQIENALTNANNMNDWKNNLKNNYALYSEIYLDELFASYNF